LKGYILKRIIIAIITMFLVVTVVFFVFRLGGADPVAIMMPPDASPADAENLTRKFGRVTTINVTNRQNTWTTG